MVQSRETKFVYLVLYVFVHAVVLSERCSCTRALATERQIMRILNGVFQGIQHTAPK